MYNRLRQRLRAAWQAFHGPPVAAGFMAGEPAQGMPGEAAPGYPPGTRPVVAKSQEVLVDGVPHLRFSRQEVLLRDENNAKITHTIVRPTILLGCGCMVSSPRDVAYLSDICGLPVCRRCATVCVCGHKVAPKERVMVAPRTFMCIVCARQQQKMQFRARLIRFLLGGFMRDDPPPTVTPPPAQSEERPQRRITRKRQQ